MKNKLIIAICAMGMVTIFACKKRIEIVATENQQLTTKSYVKLYVAVVSALRNFIFLDGSPINGASIALGGVFPANNNYSAIDPGTKTVLIRDTLSTSTQTPVTFSQNFEPGKKYSIFTYDTLNAVKSMVVPDNFTVPADTSANLRFINLIFSRTPVPNVDIFSKRLNTNIFTNIPIAQPTGFIPFPSKNTDTLFVRETGTTNLVGTLNTFTPTEKRAYTLVFRGRYQTTTGTIARTLSVYINE